MSMRKPFFPARAAGLCLLLIINGTGRAVHAETITFETATRGVLGHETAFIPDVSSFAFGIQGQFSQVSIFYPSADSSATTYFEGVPPTLDGTLTILNGNSEEVEKFTQLQLTTVNPSSTTVELTFNYGTLTTSTSMVPLPPAVWLLLSGLGALGMFARKRLAA